MFPFLFLSCFSTFYAVTMYVFQMPFHVSPVLWSPLHCVLRGFRVLSISMWLILLVPSFPFFPIWSFLDFQTSISKCFGCLEKLGHALCLLNPSGSAIFFSFTFFHFKCSINGDPIYNFFLSFYNGLRWFIRVLRSEMS